MDIIKPVHMGHYDKSLKRQSEELRHPIFAITADGAGERVATGALDGSIRIWDTRDHSLLSTMRRHTGAVMCLAWSSNGLLASGSDDCLILIWKRRLESVVQGNLGEGGVEDYQVLKRLTGGHQSDGQVLASCGLDNAICIWACSASGDCALTRKLEKAHSGFIKGISWGPNSAYLVSQSDDQSLALWRRSDWTLVAKVTSPFADSPTSTFFRRPSWSPDGEVVAAANACNGNAPVCLLLSTKDLLADGLKPSASSAKWISLVGHVTPIEVTAFSPVPYGAERAGIVAAGSQDGTVSLWSSASSRPLAILDGLFEHSVMGFAWCSPSVLYAVSYDGHVARIQLQVDPLVGPPCVVPEEQKSTLADATPRESLPTSIAAIKDGKRRITPQLLQSVDRAPASATLLPATPHLAREVRTLKTMPRRLSAKTRSPFVVVQEGVRMEANRTSLTASYEGHSIWKEPFARPVTHVLACSDASCWAATGTDLWLMSIWTGRRLQPAVVFESPIVWLFVAGDSVHVLTGEAMLHRIGQNVRSWQVPLAADAELVSVDSGALHFVDHASLLFDGEKWLSADAPSGGEYSLSTTAEAILNGLSRYDPTMSLPVLESLLSLAIKTGRDAPTWVGAYAQRCLASGLDARLRELAHQEPTAIPWILASASPECDLYAELSALCNKP